MSCFQKIEAEEDSDEQLKMGLLIVVHGKELRVAKVDTSNSVSVFMKRQSLYY
jgi:hypothetical protein